MILAKDSTSWALFGAVTKEQVQEITSNLVCLCGCGNKTVSVCGCGVADATTKEVETMMNQGKTAEEIFAHYVNASGVTVLAAPPKSGFNLVAWVLPFAGILAGGIFLLSFMRAWQSKMTRGEAVLNKARDKALLQPETANPYRERMSREMDKID